MSLTLVFWLLLFWCGFNFLSLLIAIVLFLLLISAINELHGWD
ncbi:E10 protein [Bos taurus papillomavirus 29]|uniref:E10 protein n=1 Tax=Bos taurus papillomavirus 29 TaxID=2777992 RepID=A0A7I6PPU9_9PAPI|nr:E10 protein [Bos taurus papillomavirus 29]